MKFVGHFSFSGVIIYICPLQSEYIVTVAGVESRYTYRLKGFYLDRNAKFSNWFTRKFEAESSGSFLEQPCVTDLMTKPDISWSNLLDRLLEISRSLDILDQMQNIILRKIPGLITVSWSVAKTRQMKESGGMDLPALVVRQWKFCSSHPLFSLKRKNRPVTTMMR